MGGVFILTERVTLDSPHANFPPWRGIAKRSRNIKILLGIYIMAQKFEKGYRVEAGLPFIKDSFFDTMFRFNYCLKCAYLYKKMTEEPCNICLVQISVVFQPPSAFFLQSDVKKHDISLLDMRTSVSKNQIDIIRDFPPTILEEMILYGKLLQEGKVKGETANGTKKL